MRQSTEARSGQPPRSPGDSRAEGRPGLQGEGLLRPHTEPVLPTLNLSLKPGQDFSLNASQGCQGHSATHNQTIFHLPGCICQAGQALGA